MDDRRPFGRTKALLRCGALVICFSSRLLADEKVTFDDHLAPILKQRCGSCHNPTAKKADLDVSNYLALMQGGASGAVIEAGDAEASYLYSLVAHEAEPYMPQNADKIPDAEIDLLRRWIDGGALENQGSKAVKPKPKMTVAFEGVPGAKPEVIPLPPRMVLEPHFRTTRPPMARSLATSPWAPLAAVTGQRQILLYDTATLEPKGALAFPEGQPNVVRFSRDGRLLLAGGGHPAASGKVIVWDITTGERVFEIGNELDAVFAADISADQSQIALGGPQRIVRVYSTATGELQYEITKHTDWVLAAEFSPDGVLLATADRNGGLHLWEAKTGREYLTLNGHTAAVTSLSWRADSNVLASGSEDATVRLWEPENGTQVKNWNAQRAVLSLEFARDARLVTCGRDQVTRLWDQEGKQLSASPPIGEVAVSVSFCDESLRTITGSWAGAVQVYKSEDATAVGSLSTNPLALEEQLQAAKQLLQDRMVASQPLVEALSKAQTLADAASSELTTAEQQAATLQKEVDTLTAQSNELTQQRADIEDERNKIAASQSQFQTAIPLISESLRHLTEASAKLPEDKELTEAHNRLTEQLHGMETKIKELQVETDKLAAAVNEATNKQTETNARLEVVRKETAAAAERLAALKSQAESTAAAVEAARPAAESAKSQIVEAEGQVKRWQDEIVFRDRMAELQNKLQAARKMVTDRQADLEKSNEQLAAVQSAVETANEKVAEASRGVEQLDAEIRQARTGK
jgi:peptidoglycan hydrolase CwlO-like protein